ncbi:putative tpr-like protein [Erysiphe neolycopersici]|uniref:Putative tpr-like protein n=1 Tax=Erysiphe neolycopersici TaxID=212602 RepID=A0A420I4R7_9PEZI|nr:putative tpr-like protein [Erysiphe neolycopersici]
MADSAIHQWKCAQQIEEELLTLLHACKPTYEDIENLIHKLRTACENTIFLNFEFAAKAYVEKRLWHAHTLINNRYRKILGRYKNETKLVVEKRKVEKHYVDFIKTSQFFYKSYIQRLASHFSGIKGLLRVAGQLCLDRTSNDISTSVSPEVQKLIEHSCHVTLLQLGDLSRYRNMLGTKKRSWEPAMGYYQLANEIDPLSGMAHNKMAVIALADENHLNAVYHLFRAIAALKPDVLAPGNLEIEFKKILAARFTTKNDPLAKLMRWFILLQANFNEGTELPSIAELQNEVLSKLCLCVSDESYGNILEKFVLISIAAQYNSSQRLQDQGLEKSPEAMRVLNYHINFNNRMMFQLLSILIPELDQHSVTSKDTDGKFIAIHEKISVVAGRVIPALRHYTLWLASSKKYMKPSFGSSQARIQSRQLWISYAVVLTKLVNYFPVKRMATVPYLLDEDYETIGFAPFRNIDLIKALDFYSKPDGQLKLHIGEYGVKRSNTDVEMQSRILDIVCCGIQLQLDGEIPLQLQNDSGIPVFHFIDDDQLPLNSLSKTSENSSIYQTENVAQNNDLAIEAPDEIHDKYGEDSDSEDSFELSMNRMVDSLLEPSSNEPKVDSHESFYGPNFRASSEPFVRVTSNASEYSLQSTPKLLPSLPGLYSTAFTPQPNELQKISPEGSKLSRHLSTFSPEKYDDQNFKVSAVDGINSYSFANYSSYRGSSNSFSGPRTRDTIEPISTGLSNYKPK